MSGSTWHGQLSLSCMRPQRELLPDFRSPGVHAYGAHPAQTFDSDVARDCSQDNAERQTNPEGGDGVGRMLDRTDNGVDAGASEKGREEEDRPRAS
jgi:hypothetical protein